MAPTSLNEDPLLCFVFCNFQFEVANAGHSRRNGPELFYVGDFEVDGVEECCVQHDYADPQADFVVAVVNPTDADACLPVMANFWNFRDQALAMRALISMENNVKQLLSKKLCTVPSHVCSKGEDLEVAGFLEPSRL